ncbi:DegV family protein [Paenibacillus silvae]|uniref:DegV family protein n=1 Tax=Paenibacillus silvae TaxID=1325358 RepID=UPI002004B4D0|nr:DegV family protein [Paenibacillus silvae]MCK6074399.1 DegV family protein [Paenibacillus silvae]MCK6148123.1 DegV family protein [Paenibacillus silvae]MCK6266423.1 DegV family protein [Paenibacillus silvae]
MARIKIFADSTSDLTPQWVQQYDIGIIPLYVVFGEQSLKDGAEIKPEQLYERVNRDGALPKTAAPSPADFMAAFQPYIEQGDDILYISLSSELSSTYQNALIASSEFPEARISVIDSLNLSSGIGLMVMKAAHAAEQGQNLAQITELIEAMKPTVRTEFVIDTLEYLYKGGRCSGMQNLIGSLLKIRPVIRVTDGKMTPAYKVRGKREKALEQMLQNTLSDKERIDQDLLIVVHTMAEEDAIALQQTLQEQTGARVELTTAGCVICSHCGPKTIGIIYNTAF